MSQWASHECVDSSVPSDPLSEYHQSPQSTICQSRKIKKTKRHLRHRIDGRKDWRKWHTFTGARTHQSTRCVWQSFGEYNFLAKKSLKKSNVPIIGSVVFHCERVLVCGVYRRHYHVCVFFIFVFTCPKMNKYFD